MSEDSSSGMTAIVAIVAIVILLGVGYFIFQKMQNDPNPAINVTLPGGDNQ